MSSTITISSFIHFIFYCFFLRIVVLKFIIERFTKKEIMIVVIDLNNMCIKAGLSTLSILSRDMNCNFCGHFIARVNSLQIHGDFTYTFQVKIAAICTKFRACSNLLRQTCELSL